MENVLGSLKYLVDQFGLIDFLDILFVFSYDILCCQVYQRQAGKQACHWRFSYSFNIAAERSAWNARSRFPSFQYCSSWLDCTHYRISTRAPISTLEKVGGSSFKALKNSVAPKDKEHSKAEGIANICQAASELSREYTGALIVIERNTPLGDIIKTGTVVNCRYLCIPC